MPVFVRTSTMPAPLAALSAWHFRPRAIDRMVPPWEHVQILERGSPAQPGSLVKMKIRVLGMHVDLEARHEDAQPDQGFTDVQVKGPFASWTHRHSFMAHSATQSVLEDRINYELPGGVVGRMLGGATMQAKLERSFAWRHQRLRHDLTHHLPYGDERLSVAVSGTNGLVGSALVPFLTTGGHAVKRIVRKAREASEGDVLWDPDSNTFDGSALEGLDVVVHLAGAGIADQSWSDERKRIIVDSRVGSTQALARTLAGLRNPPKVLVCASAIGFYGSRSADETLTEQSKPGQGFLSETCLAWEAAADAARAAGIRVVHVRIGVVLAGQGGILGKLFTPFKMGMGGRVGDGTQVMSWVDLDDLLGILRFVMSKPVQGPVNAVSPEPVSNMLFSKLMGAVLKRPALAPLPAPVVQAMFGEMGRELLLGGARVEPAVLKAAGFKWVLPSLEPALRFETGHYT